MENRLIADSFIELEFVVELEERSQPVGQPAMNVVLEGLQPSAAWFSGPVGTGTNKRKNALLEQPRGCPG